ncbi:MAG: YtxH domain-containing protein [Paludibacter sp.]|nr:YtxH domain-containing protein [Paludibacter sp.]
MNSGKVALSVLAAAATGALLGILFAPAKGSALRRKIHRMSEKEVDLLKEKFNDFVDGISQNFEKAKKNIVDFEHRSASRNEEKVKTAESN